MHGDSAGVVYCCGDDYFIRMVVSLWSLRKSGYAGPAAVYAMGEKGKALLPRLHADGRLEPLILNTLDPSEHGAAGLAFKPLLALERHCLFDRTLFLDADTVVVRPPDALLAALEDHDLVLTGFSDWRAQSPAASRQLDAWRPVVGDFLVDGCRGSRWVNTGVVGFRRGTKAAADWLALTLRGMRLPACDEGAMNLLLPGLTSAALVADQWNCSPEHGANKDRAKIWHFHDGLHARPPGQILWQTALHDALVADAGGVGEWINELGGRS